MASTTPIWFHDGNVAYYILIANRLGFGDRAVRPGDVIRELLPHKLWLLPNMAPYVLQFDRGDHFLVYAGKESSFYASAEGAGRVSDLDPTLVPSDLPGLGGFFRYMLRFRSVTLFPTPLPASAVLSKLSFVQNRKYWGLHFRQSVRRISEKDFQVIVRQGMRAR